MGSSMIMNMIMMVKKRKRTEEEESDKRKKIVLTNNFPDDLVDGILLNLPEKSLLRFKCVSQQWHTLISSRPFIRDHLHYNIHNNPNDIYYVIIVDRLYFLPSIIIDYDLIKTSVEEFEDDRMGVINSLPPTKILNRRYALDITCCCDGIMCVSLSDRLFLWNPHINEYKELSIPDFDNIFSNTSSPPTLPWEVFGVGYDSSINDYKVVRVPSYGGFFNDKEAMNPNVYVMTLKSNLWRKICTDFRYVVHKYQQTIHTAADGNLYWFAHVTPEMDPTKIVLITFDLAKEIFREVAMPPNVDVDHLRNVRDMIRYEKRDIRDMRLGVLGGYLSLASYNQCSHCFDIWILKGETNWIKFISFPLKLYKGPGFIGTLRPLFLNNDGALVMHATLCRFHEVKSPLIISPNIGLIYDPKQTTCNIFYINITHSWDEVCVYTPSRLSFLP